MCRNSYNYSILIRSQKITNRKRKAIKFGACAAIALLAVIIGWRIYANLEANKQRAASVGKDKAVLVQTALWTGKMFLQAAFFSVILSQSGALIFLLKLMVE